MTATSQEKPALTTDEMRIKELEAIAWKNREAFLASKPKRYHAGGLWFLHHHLPDDLREEYELLTNWGGKRDRAEAEAKAKAAKEEKKSNATEHAEQNADDPLQMVFFADAA